MHLKKHTLKKICPFCKKLLNCCNQSINPSTNKNLFIPKEINTTNSRYIT